jgi:hypothetical protein
VSLCVRDSTMPSVIIDIAREYISGSEQEWR